MEAGVLLRPTLLRILCLTALLVPSSASADGQVTKQQCISTNESGQDLRRAGKLHAAAERFTFCSTTGCPATLREDCSTRLQEVQRAMPTVVFEVKDARGGGVTAVTVTLDGAPFADRLDGTSLPVEPGRHRFAFRTTGVSPVEKELTFREGEKDRHERVSLPGGGQKHEDTVVAVPSSSPGSPTGAYVAFGVAGVGVVVGAVFTGVALAEKAKCPNDAGQTSCPPPIDSKENDAAVKRDSLLAGIGYGVGVLSGAIGLWLLLSNATPKPETNGSRPSLQVQPLLGTRWLGVEGKF